ncbi:MAG: LemA family protein [Anaerolineaceae bacterium]|nr:LemA family protein [Anaerolineaceae bacterium]
MSRGCIIGVIVVVVIGLIMAGVIVSGYNKAVRLDEGVTNRWAQVENQLKRRFDLIPNLVETVKGYAKHEKGIIENVAEARTKYFQAGSVAQKAAAAGTFERALSRLLMLQERYPDLKANESFLKLQDELAGTENRIAVERMRYNEAVRAVNTYRREFLGRFFCSWAGVQQAEYFKIPEAEKETPKVKF